MLVDAHAQGNAAALTDEGDGGNAHGGETDTQRSGGYAEGAIAMHRAGSVASSASSAAAGAISLGPK